MAFKIGDIVVERILHGVAENKATDTVLYTLNQLQTASIDVTSTSTDITDKDGNLVKRIYTGKTGEFTASNAFLNINILGEQTGNGVTVATDEKPIIMPKTIVVKAGETPTLAGLVKLTDSPATYDISVSAYEDEIIGDAYTLGASASATEFALTEVKKGGDGADKDDVIGYKIDLPTDDSVKKFFIKYKRSVKSGVQVKNTTTSFPQVVRLTLKVLASDLCNNVKLAYITIPSFQVSPDVSIAVDKDNQQVDFNGNLNVDYCSDDKELYTIDIAEGDTEENA